MSTDRACLANPPATGPKTVEIIKTEEKGSDVALATYLMLDACRGDCGPAVLITNDPDLRAQVARMAQRAAGADSSDSRSDERTGSQGENGHNGGGAGWTSPK